MMQNDFEGRRVVSFENRKATELVSLIERHGGVAVNAPSMREVALHHSNDLRALANRLREGSLDIVVLLTGVGTRTLVDAIESVMNKEEFVAALLRVPMVVARGPKPAAALREIGVAQFMTVPEPNTWSQILAALLASGSLAGKRIAVQEYGVPNHELYAVLNSEGALICPIPVYRWALPEDIAPLRDALSSIASGESRIALFTSRVQVEHAMLVASEDGIADAVKRCLRQGIVASIGPICTEALRLEGITADVQPEHPKMGHLVKETAARAARLLREKR